jgi:superfamily I DNA and RNA helicase
MAFASSENKTRIIALHADDTTVLIQDGKLARETFVSYYSNFYSKTILRKTMTSRLKNDDITTNNTLDCLTALFRCKTNDSCAVFALSRLSSD